MLTDGSRGQAIANLAKRHPGPACKRLGDRGLVEILLPTAIVPKEQCEIQG